MTEAAREIANAPGKTKINPSRISAMTGIYRKEVAKIFKEEDYEPRGNPGILWRVLAAWETSPEFTTTSGKPRALSYGSEDSDFAELCRFVSTDLHDGTVLFELVRIGAVEKSEQSVKLKKTEESLAENLDQAFELLSQDLDNLTRCVEEGSRAEKRSPHLHLTTNYDNVYQDALPAIRKWLSTEGKRFHKKLRAFIAKYDSDITPDPKGKRPAGASVAVTAFSFSQLPKDAS